MKQLCHERQGHVKTCVCSADAWHCTNQVAISQWLSTLCGGTDASGATSPDQSTSSGHAARPYMENNQQAKSANVVASGFDVGVMCRSVPEVVGMLSGGGEDCLDTR